MQVKVICPNYPQCHNRIFTVLWVSKHFYHLADEEWYINNQIAQYYMGESQIEIYG